MEKNKIVKEHWTTNKWLSGYNKKIYKYVHVYLQ